jgi:2-polyprenyl-3-methyl-5-hydroxy-6-metoxy-1,4-benzoquinol methylase
VPASTHWRRLVRARLGEQEELSTGSGTLGGAYWDTRARRYARRVAGSAEGDPFLARVRRAVVTLSPTAAPDGAGPVVTGTAVRSGRRRAPEVQPGTTAAGGVTVLDVGAGPGRFSLALAPEVGRVVAVDPSREMLAILRREARARGLANVTVVHSTWQEAAPVTAEVVVCSHVLPVIEDASRFLAKLDAACTGRAFVSMAAMTVDAPMDHLWRHFHRRPRRPGPTYLDAVAVLEELGIKADVEVVEVPTLARYANLAEAVKSCREVLLLPDTAAVRNELRKLLASWLVAEEGGVRVPLPWTPVAIVSWTGGQGGQGGQGGRRAVQSSQRRRRGR